MSKTIIGPNTAIRHLKAYRAHCDYWHEVNPAVLLAYVDKKDHTVFIQEYAAEFEDSLVVARVWHPLDGGFHLPPSKPEEGHYVASPTNYHNDYGFLGRIENVTLGVMNEPDGFADEATIQRLVDWLTEYIPVAAQAKTKSTLINFGKGQPRIINGVMDSRFGTVLKMASYYPDLFTIGLHFYGLQSLVVSIEGYLALCDSIGITPLRVIGTEFGNDDGAGGKEEAVWEIDQVKTALAPFIQSGVLIGLNRFQDGNSGGWDHYAIEDDKPYKDEIKRAALAGELTVNTDTVSKKNIILGQTYRLIKEGDVIKAYAVPYSGDPVPAFKTIPSNATVVVLDKKVTNGATWLKVMYQAFTLPVYIQSDLIDIRQTVETAVVKLDELSDAPTKPLPPLPQESVTPPTKPDVGAVVETPQIVPLVAKQGYCPSAAELTTLQLWRKELVDKLALVDSILASVQVQGVSHET